MKSLAGENTKTQRGDLPRPRSTFRSRTRSDCSLAGDAGPPHNLSSGVCSGGDWTKTPPAGTTPNSSRGFCQPPVPGSAEEKDFPIQRAKARAKLSVKGRLTAVLFRACTVVPWHPWPSLAMAWGTEQALEAHEDPTCTWPRDNETNKQSRMSSIGGGRQGLLESGPLRGGCD